MSSNLNENGLCLALTILFCHIRAITYEILRGADLRISPTPPIFLCFTHRITCGWLLTKIWPILDQPFTDVYLSLMFSVWSCTKHFPTIFHSVSGCYSSLTNFVESYPANHLDSLNRDNTGSNLAATCETPMRLWHLVVKILSKTIPQKSEQSVHVYIIICYTHDNGFHSDSKKVPAEPSASFKCECNSYKSLCHMQCFYFYLKL